MPHVIKTVCGGTSTGSGGTCRHTRRRASPKCCGVRSVHSVTIPRISLVSGVLTLTLCLPAPVLAQDESGSSAASAASSTGAGHMRAERLRTTEPYTVRSSRFDSDTGRQEVLVETFTKLPVKAAEAPTRSYFAASVKSTNSPAQTVTVYVQGT